MSTKTDAGKVAFFSVRGLGSSILASLVLAVLTLFVFGMLQDSGPVSTIRRFNVAVLNGDEQGIVAVTDSNLNDPDELQLIGQIRALLSAGAEVQLAGMRNLPGSVLATVAYRLPNGQIVPVVFVVDQRTSGWKVNLSASIDVMRRSFGG